MKGISVAQLMMPPGHRSASGPARACHCAPTHNLMLGQRGRLIVGSFWVEKLLLYFNECAQHEIQTLRLSHSVSDRIFRESVALRQVEASIDIITKGRSE